MPGGRWVATRLSRSVGLPKRQNSSSGHKLANGAPKGGGRIRSQRQRSGVGWDDEAEAEEQEPKEGRSGRTETVDLGNFGGETGNLVRGQESGDRDQERDERRERNWSRGLARIGTDRREESRTGARRHGEESEGGAR